MCSPTSKGDQPRRSGVDAYGTDRRPCPVGQRPVVFKSVGMSGRTFHAEAVDHPVGDRRRFSGGSVRGPLLLGYTFPMTTIDPAKNSDGEASYRGSGKALTWTVLAGLLIAAPARSRAQHCGVHGGSASWPSVDRRNAWFRSRSCRGCPPSATSAVSSCRSPQ